MFTIPKLLTLHCDACYNSMHQIVLIDNNYTELYTHMDYDNLMTLKLHEHGLLTTMGSNHFGTWLTSETKVGQPSDHPLPVLTHFDDHPTRKCYHAILSILAEPHLLLLHD